MRQYIHKRPKYNNPDSPPEDRVVPRRDNTSPDGYRLHRNPDGTWMYLEGRKLGNGKSLIWGRGDTKKLDECCRRRGLIRSRDHRFFWGDWK